MSGILRSGQILLATPELQGSFFGRAVIFLTAHSGVEGTHGFVLNRPSGAMLGEVMSSVDFAALREVPVLLGGPVCPDEMTLGALRWDANEGTLEWRGPLGIGGAVRARAEGWTVCAFTGYTGWAVGQLEAEVERGSWLVMAGVEAVLAPVEGDALWRAILRGLADPRLALLADQPADPGLN